MADCGVTLQIINEIGPTAGAGPRPVDEHDGNLTAPIGLKAHELCGRLVEKIAVKEAGKFAFPNLRVAESKGVRSAGINFQRNRLPGNVHIALFESRMDLDRAVEVPLR